MAFWRTAETWRGITVSGGRAIRTSVGPPPTTPAVEQRIIVRNPTKIRCRVKAYVGYYQCSTLNDILIAGQEPGPKKRCAIRIGVDGRLLASPDELCTVSIWVLATAWGRYEDAITVELDLGTRVLPALRIPIVIRAVTFPVEYPLVATGGQRPTVKFNLYSMDIKHQMQISNNSDIPVNIYWRIYNKCEKNRPFRIVFDTFASENPSLWSLRMDRYYGTESPGYFKIEPLVLKLEPKELGFVTFSLDRTKETTAYRDENNIVFGQAIGIINALEPPGKYCVREDGSKLKPTVVELFSETRHSIQPNLVLRETDNIFRVWATQIYESRSLHHTVTKSFTMLNLLRYPATVSFRIEDPFVVKALRTLRCGTRQGNSDIRVLYEDLIEIDLEANINMTEIRTPKMPTKEESSRKTELVGRLYAVCHDSYFEPKMVAPFEVRVYFPILKLSTSNINFGQVAVRETKSAHVILSSYPGPERFVARSKNQAFTISPTDGFVSHKPIPLKITFQPKADVRYSNKIEISTTIPMDVIFLEVSGFGIE